MAEVGTLFVRIGAKIDQFEAGMRKVQDRLKQAEQRFEGMRAIGQRFTAVGAKMATTGAAMGVGLGAAVKIEEEAAWKKAASKTKGRRG